MTARGPLLGAGLEGRAMIVTGAGSGVGRSTALALAACGARVALLDRDGGSLDAAMSEIADPDRHMAVPFDLARVPDLPGMVDGVVRQLGGLWGIAHVAAVLKRQRVDDVTEADWDLQHTVNLKSSFFLNRAVGQELIRLGQGGRIINFTSGAFLTGALSGSDAYVASKGGVVTMTRSFAKQYGPHGILVNCVSPGQIDTPMQYIDNPPEIVEAAIKTCPLRRIGRPDEVASVVVFLASSHASFVSGATINVSGGQTLY